MGLPLDSRVESRRGRLRGSCRSGFVAARSEESEMIRMRLTQAVDRAAVTRADGLATRMGERSQNWAEFRSRVSRLAQGLVDVAEELESCTRQRPQKKKRSGAWCST